MKITGRMWEIRCVLVCCRFLRKTNASGKLGTINWRMEPGLDTPVSSQHSLVRDLQKSGLSSFQTPQPSISAWSSHSPSCEGLPVKSKRPAGCRAGESHLPLPSCNLVVVGVSESALLCFLVSPVTSLLDIPASCSHVTHLVILPLDVTLVPPLPG